jgi:hypothetical protein
MSYQQQPKMQFRQPNNQPMQQPYRGQMPQGYQQQQQPMQRMQRPPKRSIGLDISSMISPKKRKFFLNLISIGFCFLLVYGIASFFVYHTEFLNPDVEGIDYMGYIGSDFLLTVLPLIFLGFFYMLLKGKKLNVENIYPQVNLCGQPQPQQYQQQPQQQPQYQKPQFMQQQPIQQPVQHIPVNPSWNPPPNYWINPQQQMQQQPPQPQPKQPIPQQQQYQQPAPQKTGTWKCPRCGNFSSGNFCNQCGYGKKLR